VVSVLFADLAGFTSRSERLDVEDVEEFLAPYHGLLRVEVERTGGVVAKFTGDGVMALFGAPVAHEDDPERAVRCAIAIRERLAETEGDQPDRLRVRVGVTTGESLVVLSDGAVDAVGDVVNTAARLESAAPTDGVLVDEFTFRATSRVIRYEQAESVTAKGKSDAVPVWLAVEPRSVVPEQARVALPLIGRERDRASLVDALERSRNDPSTQLVSVIGEPGIGKTRLVEELLAYVEEMPELVTWRRGRSLSYGEGVSFWALGEMVKAQAGILESDSARIAEAKLAAAVSAVVVDEQDRRWIERHLGPLVGLEAVAGGAGSGGRVEAFAAWRRFFESLAEDGPTVLVFEDIHWADDALLDFIDLLADRAGAIPLLIACTARPELLERREHWGGGKTNATTISLTPLADEETARLVAELLGQAVLPVAVQETLLERSVGNPLYAQEYVRMLQDRGLLTHGSAGWTLNGEVDALPESIQGIIAARLDTLTADEKALILDAAVVGKTAWIGAVCALTERSLWDAEELLHSLERKQLVQRVRRSSIQGEVEFTFGHALTRDVAYSQIRRAGRAQKHEAAAEWIERLPADRDDKAELLADHYSEALKLREQLGDDTAELTPKARAAFIEAARQAAAVYAHPAAARHYGAALELTRSDDAKQRAALLFGEATALFHANAADEHLLDAAAEAQVAAEAWEEAALIERMLCIWCTDYAGRGEEWEAHLALAAEYVGRVPAGDVTYQIASEQAHRLTVSGHAEEVLALTTDMLAAADNAGLEASQALMLTWHGYARVATGDADGTSDMWTAADTLARHAHSSTPMAYGNLADCLRGLGEMRAADDAYDAAGRWAARMGSSSHINWIATERAVQAYHGADWGTSESLLHQVDTTYGVDEAQVRATAGRIALARGDHHRALADAAASIAYAETSNNNDLYFIGIALAAMCYSAADRLADAIADCDRFLSRWHESHGPPSRTIELCEIAPTLARADRLDDVHTAALRLPQGSHWREALFLLAEGRYADAATRYEQIGSEPLAADAHLLAADQAHHKRQRLEVPVHAEAVIDFAERTGALAYQHRAEALLKASA
jgi:class 3 adenylate cyclase